MKRYSDELYHFGIKGMRWGVRRGRSSGSGRKKRTSNPEKEARKAKIKKGAKEIATTALKIGAVSAGIGLARYGASRGVYAIGKKMAGKEGLSQVANKYNIKDVKELDRIAKRGMVSDSIGTAKGVAASLGGSYATYLGIKGAQKAASMVKQKVESRKKSKKR